MCILPSKPLGIAKNEHPGLEILSVQLNNEAQLDGSWGIVGDERVIELSFFLS